MIDNIFFDFQHDKAKISKIIDFLKSDKFHIFNYDIELLKISSLDVDDDFQNKYLSFITKKNKNIFIDKANKFGLLLAPIEFSDLIDKDLKANIIFVANPRIAISDLMSFLYKDKTTYGSENNADKYRDIIIENDVYIGKNVKIGKNCIIKKGAVIRDNCIIGNNVIIDEYVVISHSIIGDNCVIGSFSRIGHYGFGIEANKDGNFEQINHIGHVILEDNISIGVHATICRGMIENTHVSLGCKFDDKPHIAHNAIVGKNGVFAGRFTISGSSNIGDNALVGGSVSLKDNISVGNNVIISAGTNIYSSILDNTHYTGGVPELPHNQWIRATINYKKTSKLKSNLKKL